MFCVQYPAEIFPMKVRSKAVSIATYVLLTPVIMLHLMTFLHQYSKLDVQLRSGLGGAFGIVNYCLEGLPLLFRFHIILKLMRTVLRHILSSLPSTSPLASTFSAASPRPLGEHSRK